MQDIHSVTRPSLDVAITATRPGRESRESKNLALVLSTATIRGPWRSTPSVKLIHEIHGIKERSTSTRASVDPFSRLRGGPDRGMKS